MVTGFRYNAGGQLVNPIFPAAAAIGAGSRPSGTQSILNINAQLQANQANQINQLQNAHQALIDRTQQGQTPTASAAYFGPSQPLGDSIRTSKQLALSTIDPDDLSDDQKAMFGQQVDNPGVNPQDFFKLVQTAATANKTKKQQAMQTQKDQEAQAKAAKAETDRQAQQKQQSQTQAIQDQINQQTTDVNSRRAGLMKVGLGSLADHSEQSPELLLQLAGNDPEAVRDIQAYRLSKKKLDSLNQQLQTVANPNQSQYQEGQILHSPSTGRTFKVVNGQPMEIPNAGQ